MCLCIFCTIEQLACVLEMYMEVDTVVVLYESTDRKSVV